MTKSISGSQRSAHRLRKILRTRAEIRLDAERRFHARTIDISIAGMSLMSPQALNIGAGLTVIFQIPAQGKLETVNAAASVLYNTADRAEGFRLGLRFNDHDSLRDDLIASLL